MSSTTRSIRTAGLAGAVGGAALVTIGVLAGVGDPAQAVDVALTAVGFTGMVVVLVALLRIGATSTRSGRAGLVAWIVGVLAIAAGALAGTLGLPDFFGVLFPIGGLGQLVGGLIAGVSIARSGRLDGWARWAPLAWAAAYVVMTPFQFTESVLGTVTFVIFGGVVIAASLGVAGATAPADTGIRRDSDLSGVAATS